MHKGLRQPMGQSPFLGTSSIEFSYSESRFQKIFPHPMNQKSCKRWLNQCKL